MLDPGGQAKRIIWQAAAAAAAFAVSWTAIHYGMAVVALALQAYVLIWLLCPSPRVLVFLSMSLFVASTSTLLPSSVGSETLRVAAAAILLRTIRPTYDFSRLTVPALRESGRLAFPPMLGLFLAGYLVYASFTSLPHGDARLFFSHVLAAVLFIVCYAAFRSGSSDGTHMNLVILILALSVGWSMVLGLEDAATALVHDRLRGITGNANTLGFVSFLLYFLAATTVRSRPLSLALMFSALGAVVWSASRASALALILATFLLALARNDRARYVLGLVAMVSIALLLHTGLDAVTGSELFRDTASRSGALDQAVRVIQVAPLSGLGARGEDAAIASTPLLAIVHAGMPGLLGVLVMYLALIFGALRTNRTLGILAATAVVHSFFEGWLLSAASPLLILFLATCAAVASCKQVDAIHAHRGVESELNASEVVGRVVD